MILTLSGWLTCKLLTRNLWFMKSDPATGLLAWASWASAYAGRCLTSLGPSLITSLLTFPRVKSLWDLRFNASFHHIKHSPSHTTPDDIQNSLGLLECIPKNTQKSKIIDRQIISTKEMQLNLNFWVEWHFTSMDTGVSNIFFKIFLGMFAQYKNAGQLQVYS